MAELPILLLNGPNLNLLGVREPEIYGSATLEDAVSLAREAAARHGLDLEHLQSNHEGELVDAIHRARETTAGLILNAGALTHYGWSIHDALAGVSPPLGGAPRVQPGQPGTVAPCFGHSVCGGWHSRRIRRRRLRPRRRCSGLDAAAAMTTLPPISVRDRLPQLRGALQLTGADTLVVTQPVNIRYLSGFTGSAARMVITSERSALLTDGRYGKQARDQLGAAGTDTEVFVGSREEQTDALVDLAEGAVVVEDSTPWAAVLDLGASLGRDPLPASGLVEELREVKDQAELARISVAARIADDALSEIAPLLGSGLSEVQLARNLERTMQDLGADGPSFPTILASGPNAALPHARPTERVPARGDLVIVDFGAEVDGYRSDMTRTFVVGEPDARARQMIDVVTSAQAAGVSAAGPGVTTSEIDRACRCRIDDAGMGEAFTHGTGHGVGLVIHEDPFIGRRTEGVLAPGHVVTVEPGVYFEGYGGVRVEDTLLITSDGARSLTNHPKEPVSVPG